MTTRIRNLVRSLVVVALSWVVLSSLSVFPHQLAYFNELAGGSSNGYRHLQYSNLDWGQDLLLIQEWMESNKLEPKQVQMIPASWGTPTGLIDVATLGSKDVEWEVVSSQNLFASDSRWEDTVHVEPASRIGYTHWAFSVPLTCD